MTLILEDGGSAETAVIGNEGIVVISTFMGGGSMPSRAVVQSAGRALRLSSKAIKEGFDLNGPVTRLMLRYTQALIAQIAQTGACNRHHSAQAWSGAPASVMRR